MPVYIISPEVSLNVVFTDNGCNLTLICLHFWGGSSRTFGALDANLSPSYNTISIDFRGWGNSTGPQSADAYSILNLAEDVEAVIAKFDLQQFVLVGHSMGGKVCQLIAGRAKVAGLQAIVLLCPAPPTPLILPEEMRTQQMAAYDSAASAEYVIRNVLTSVSIAEDTISVLVEDIMKGNVFAKRAWPTYAMSEDIVTEAKKIHVPVLIIAGGKDKVETLQRIREAVVGIIKNAEMVVIEESGHLLPLEAPEKVSKHIHKFLHRVTTQ